MKVSKALEMLAAHDPNEEIIIEWWARDFMEITNSEDETIEIPLDAWNEAADGYEFGEYTYQEMFSQIEEAIYSAINEQEKTK